MGGCGSTSAIKIPHEKRYRRAIKLYQVTEVKSLTNLLNRNKCFESGESPLTLAAQEGHEAVVQSLVASGADVNKLDNNGKGPLHIAVQLNDEETVDILLNANANPNKYDSGNATPLHLASENGNSQLVRRLLKAGSYVNENQRGLSPLVYAVVHGHVECVDELLRHGADPNVLDARGNTLLHVSVRNKDPQCVQLLLEFKASPRLPSHDNTSLVCLACLTGCHETLKLLIELGGCDVSARREEEPPPVITAVMTGNADCVDVLLSAGDDPNTIDKRGHSALQIAVISVTDPSKESFFCKYFANLYRQYSKYDREVSHENSTRCVMSLVTGGVNTIKVWDRFSVSFPRPEGISFEQMVLAEVLIQCFGFYSVPVATLRTFVGKLLKAREHGLLKLLYSAGVDPTWAEESAIGMSTDENDRELFRWIKKLRTAPRSLRDLCRQRIRRAISWNVLYLVHKLPILSEEMKEYVCIMDTEHYSVGIEDGESNNNQSSLDTETADEERDPVKLNSTSNRTNQDTSKTQISKDRTVHEVTQSDSRIPETTSHHGQMMDKVKENGIPLQKENIQTEFPVNDELPVTESTLDDVCSGQQLLQSTDRPVPQDHQDLMQTDINGVGPEIQIQDGDILLLPEKMETGNGAICNMLDDKTSVNDIIIDDTLRETVA